MVHQHTFDVNRTYDYFCIPHKSLGMVARIVVSEPGGPAEGNMPPIGTVPSSQEIMQPGAVLGS
ncbi:MAG TPA: plastocyanin/azurin family copper-binding protein [Halococcus sp.]|nr:plastocyanin/azurin family copper-binding protein [Halococcus sp.]